MAKGKVSSKSTNLFMSVQYSERFSDWRLWENKADELLEAAKLLEPHVRESWNVINTDFKDGRYSDPLKTPRTPPFNPISAYFMLAAYALENILKALIIQQRPNEYQGYLFKKLPKVFKKHDLRELFKEVKIQVTVIEEDLLNRLTWQSTWAGRYPIPVESSALMNVETYSDGKSYLTTYFSPNDVDNIINLLRRVKTLIQNQQNTTSVPTPE